MTLDNWTLLQYNLANGYFMPLIPYLYCVAMVLLGNYFMLNLMLAVVFESFLKSDAAADKDTKQDLEERKTNLINKKKQIKKNEKKDQIEDKKYEIISTANKVLPNFDTSME